MVNSMAKTEQKYPKSEEGRLVKFLATDGLVLAGFFVQARKSKGCMVFVHGMTSSFYSGTLSFALADSLKKEGYSTFIINTRGHDIESWGKKFRNGKAESIRIGTRYERFEDSKCDIGGAIKFLESEGCSRIILCGHSTGCQKILYYQLKARNPCVSAMIFLAPGDDHNVAKDKYGKRMHGMLLKAYKSSRHKIIDQDEIGFSAERFLSIADPERAEARLFNFDGELKEFGSIRLPAFVALGEKDEWSIKSPDECSDILKMKTGSSSFKCVIVDGADHSFHFHEEILCREISRWLKGLSIVA